MGFSQRERNTILMALFALIVFNSTRVFHDDIYTIFDPKYYLVIHTILELTSISVSFIIAFTGWFLVSHTQSRHRLMLGSIFFAVGLLDLLHTLSYYGMPFLITEPSIGKSAWFWIIARLTESISLFVLFSLEDKPVSPSQRVRSYCSAIFIAVGVGFTIINFVEYFPALVIEEQGTTLFKNMMEYLISFLHLLTIGVLIYHYLHHKQQAELTMVRALVFLFFSELIFTLYQSVYDFDSLLGHLYKAVGYYFLYKGITNTTIHEPYMKEQQARIP